MLRHHAGIHRLHHWLHHWLHTWLHWLGLSTDLNLSGVLRMTWSDVNRGCLLLLAAAVAANDDENDNKYDTANDTADNGTKDALGSTDSTIETLNATQSIVS